MSEPNLPQPPVGLLISRDLLFTSKITGEARGLGAKVVVVAGSKMALDQIRLLRPKVVFLDLAADDLTDTAAILAYRREAGGDATLIAFGSHVDKARLDDARDAGCDEVMPRSKFSNEIVAILRRRLIGD